jgi:creatinine amidohydrolase
LERPFGRPVAGGSADLDTEEGRMNDEGQRRVRWEQLTLHQLRQEAEHNAVVLIPVGAIEQHGPHLPVETDTFIANRVCEDSARVLDHVLVAPPVAWGLSNAHVDVGATLSLRPSTMIDLGIDLSESLIRSGFARQIWVNGHASNEAVLATLVYEIKRLFGVSAGALSYYELGSDEFTQGRVSRTGGALHACEFETSLMLHLSMNDIGDVDSVHYVEPLTRFDVRDGFQPAVARIGYTFAERFPGGVAGDPSNATSEFGGRIYRTCVERLTAFISEFRNVELVIQSAEIAPTRLR